MLVSLQGGRGSSVRSSCGMLNVRIVFAMMAHHWVVVLHKLNCVVHWRWLGRLDDIDDLFMMITVTVRMLVMMLVVMVVVVRVMLHVKVLIQRHMMHRVVIMLGNSVAFSVVDWHIGFLGCLSDLSLCCRHGVSYVRLMAMAMAMIFAMMMMMLVLM